MKKAFPFYPQEGNNDCAAASILMILKYYKGSISYIKLSEMLKTTKKGTTAFHIIETLKQLGFHAEGIKTNIYNIDILPVIAHVTINKSYKHYVVIYDIDYKNKKISIADPTSGIKKYDFLEFLEIWNGIIITMYPEKKVVNESNLSIFKFIFTFLKPYKYKILKIGILSFLTTILSIIISFIFHLIFKPTLNLIILFFMILFIKNSLEYMRNNKLLKITNKIDEDMTTHAFMKIINLPYSYYQNKTNGEIVGRISDLKNVKLFLTQIIIILFTDLPLILMSLCCLFYLDIFLSLIIFSFMILIVIISLKFHKKLKKYTYLTKINNAENLSLMVEATENFETIKGIKLEEKIINNFKNNYSELIKKNYKLGKTYNKQFFFKDLVISLYSILIILIGLYLVNKNYLQFEMFITMVILSSFLTEPVQNITNLNLEYNNFSISLKRIIDIITYQNKSNNQSFSIIQAGNLYFSFDDTRNILNDINIKIENGEKIILVGSSGSGKSTLMKLIMKYYKPSKGMIRTRENITYISQNEKLFTGTLKTNLTFYEDNNFSKIIDICSLNSIIQKDDLKLNQLIEEDGFNLSGGEKQRIILARALMKKFDVLLIDEALNAVDVSMERKILKKLLTEFNDKTIVFVSHRLDNVDLFYRLIKMNKGKIVFDKKKNKGDDI